MRSWFSGDRGLQTFILCSQDRAMGHHALSVCRHYNILHHLLYLHFLLPSIILAYLLGNRTLLKQVQKVMVYN